ncbi:MAG: RecQ family zinc-binding domain-containing protein, partial [Thermostichus sp. BF3_bins_97]
GGPTGGSCQALMLVSEPTGFLDPTDRQRQAYFYRQQQRIRDQALTLLKTLPDQGSYAEVPPGDSRVALGLLQEMGCLQWRDPFQFQVLRRPRYLPPYPGADPWQGMEALINTRGCRWQVILQFFRYGPGDPSEPRALCGTCDHCRRSKKPSIGLRR